MQSCWMTTLAMATHEDLQLNNDGCGWKLIYISLVIMNYSNSNVAELWTDNQEMNMEYTSITKK